MNIKIACIDDHQLFLEGLKNIIESQADFQIVGHFNNPKKFLQALNDLPVDIATIDVEMPAMSGLELCKKIKSVKPDIKVLFISMFETLNVINQAKECGADGFISKNSLADEVFEALQKIGSGKTHFVEPLPQSKVVATATPSVLLLSKREKEIILLIKEGKTSKVIAKQLHISEYTVETHRKNIFRKLKIASVQELVSFVYENF